MSKTRPFKMLCPIQEIAIADLDAEAQKLLKGKQLSYTAVAASSTLTTAKNVVKASGTITLTLPKAALVPGADLIIINTGTGVVSVDGNGTDTINGSTSALELGAQYDYCRVFCDGSEWFVIGGVGFGV